MANGNYSVLKDNIDDYIKQNGDGDITGQVLQTQLFAMITSLGAGYQFMGVAKLTPTPTDPGSPDQNVFYVAFQPGIYSNFGSQTVADGEIAILKWNGSWTKEVTGAASAAKLDELGQKVDEKLDKVIGTNLVDGAKLEANKAIGTDGIIAPFNGYYVSDFIFVDGKDIISNANPNNATTIASFNVYDSQKQVLRTITPGQQYTYQSGDYYVRFNFKNLSTAKANYGTTLADYEPYTEYKPLTDLDGRVTEIEGQTSEIPNKLDKIFGTNIVNPDEVITGAALSWGSADGEPSTGLASNYVVSGFISVDGNNIISNAWSSNNAWSTMFIYDANKNFLRNNGTNQQYTYQDGDAYVRISWKSSSVSNWKANYGTTLADYSPYTDYKPVQDLDVRVTAIEDKIGTVDYDYTTVALFKSIAVVGDSYSSGAIYGVSGAVEGRHDGMAWLNIMARRNGIQSTGLYATPSQNTTKFLDTTDSRYNTYGLGALLSDTAKDLYFIMLGINGEPEGVSIGTVSDCNVDWTQNATSFCGNLGKIIGNIKTHAPEAKIVCIVANMLFSNLSPAIDSEKRTAIIDVAEFYDVAWMEAADNPFFSSTFYVSQLHTNHPVGTTYAGMAVAFEKLFSKCVQENPSYFADYTNDN